MAEWLEYRLEKLEFHGGGELGFKHARMMYRDDNREIAIVNLKTPPLAVDAALRKMADRSGHLPPLRTIYYEMRVAGYPRQAFFYHPMGKLAGVYMPVREIGENMLFFNNPEGHTIFSKDWTLDEVTEGRIPIDKRVWQFHGYKHEH